MDAHGMDALTIAFLIVSAVVVAGLAVAIWRLRSRVARTPDELLERDVQGREADRRKTDLLQQQDRYNIRR